MKKKILTGYTLIGIVFLLVVVNMLLPKDFFGYYRDIDMVREEQSEIYDNGVFVCTQETENRYMDFIVGEGLNIIKIKFKNTIFGYKYRVSSIQTFSDFHELLKENSEYYNQHKDLSFSYASWLDEWTTKPSEKVLWAILPAEYLVTDLESNVSTHKFTYEGEEYVLYVKVEKTE